MTLVIEKISFFNSIHRITKPDYVPSFQDDTWDYINSTGIAPSQYTNGPIEVIICDPGGRRSERMKWEQLWPNVTTILYFVDAGSYDQLLAEDNSTNRLAEEFALFESLCNGQHTAQSTIVLFMHKMDKLERKLGSIPFDSSLIKCPNAFTGDPHSLEDVKVFLRDAFLTIAHNSNRHVPVLFTSIRDAEELGKLALSFAMPR
jgi:guanine nucleotide-binding protein G(i) subunit alpha